MLVFDGMNLKNNKKTLSSSYNYIYLRRKENKYCKCEIEKVCDE